ncbi:Glutathione S-transferase [Duganella sp. CF517]|uniref:glutathione S-transferase n=1 Tax=Duganella sp. CF517 TaxID=1881038 RepID=UPI0008CD1482|nr:glutathione S-transferase [Duganella sp. CF517]SEN35832.1 Glutathione S-transferase [Duganella sp. CF517]
MKLIGMLDSPYVRRVAVSLQLLGVPFEHQSLSVFRTFDQFRQINPVVKAPTLVAGDGTVLMDSTLILQYAETLAVPERRLTPSEPAALLRSLRVLGLALAACDKGVQIVYERNVRPAEKLHQPWVERVTLQMLSAFDALEAEQRERPLLIGGAGTEHGAVMAAVTWHFMRQMLPELVAAGDYPALDELSRRAEALPQFAAAPHGDSTYSSH